jgi:cytochrome c551/c552
MQSLVENKKIKSVEEFITVMPEKWKEKYTLVYSSRSIQGASYENPRVIIYSGNTMFTFNGGESQLGGNKIEAISFNESKNKYESMEITFNPGTNAIVEHNPKSCIQCHQTEIKPIWDSYRQWPGVYGGNDDFLFKELMQNQVDPKEKNGYLTYLKNKAKNSRYSKLPDIKAETNNAGDFTSFLGNKTFTQLANKIKETKELYPFRFAIQEIALCSEDENNKFDNNFPDSFQAQLATYPSLKKEIEDFAENSLKDKDQRAKKIDPKFNQGKPSDRIEFTNTASQIAFILKMAKIDLCDYSLALNEKLQNRSCVFNYTSYRLESLSWILDKWGRVDERGEEIPSKNNMTNNYNLYKDSIQKRCEWLQKKSRESLSEVNLNNLCFTNTLQENSKELELNKQVNIIAEKISSKKVFEKCLACHNPQIENTGVPYIAFSDDKDLAKQINDNPKLKEKILKRIHENADKEIKMPPNNDLNNEERLEIKNYLKSF